ncbi:extracellular protein [Colletotrichum graminicola]|uniref:Extracellular protein n=1 Tax=Colletotrichum graminicola (strain M1.001 / M2 / FGSC 10212) TaxID=645133 RepID=E3QQ08_COLGM|nr:extracellular protein [Colletotrichum graminicola M1.001]EFQ32945.1 extracellular protein [Colletotrichum graminicola M1.001]WDK09318.1 extracellular protein [Colletotrichum graminicola]
MKGTFVSALALLASQAAAHMAITYPPPLRSKENPYSGYDIDYSITSPLSASGSDFPCKGDLKLLGTPEATPVATWQAGQTYNMTIAGGANHNGGSCQAALSFDSGKTFTVIHSYIGACPAAGTSSLKFTLPADTPSAKDAIFAWTWFNNIGNREFYMNCAVITITGGGAGGSTATSFNSRPQIFKANIANGCSTVEGSDVMFPDPGPDVTMAGTKTAAPVGNCGAVVAPNPGTGGGGSGSAPSSSKSVEAAPSATQAPQSSTLAPTTTRPAGGASSLPGGVFMTVPAPSNASAASSVQPTTFATVSQPAAPSDDCTSELGVTVSVPAASSATPTLAPSPSAGSGGDAADGSMTPGKACNPEGQWNCVSGTHFQRCASGQWSVLMSMAPGTKCQSGTTEVLVWQKKRAHGRRSIRFRHHI